MGRTRLKKRAKIDADNEKNKEPLEPPIHVTEEYLEGYRAFVAGETEESNRYKIGDTRRQRWYDGYYTARTGSRVGSTIRKYGGDWP